MRADNAGIVRIRLRIVPVEFDDRLLAFGDEGIGDGFLDVGVARRRAPLSAPCGRAPDSLLGRVRKVGRFIDEDRVLSTQLKQHGCQILGCRLHHDLADFGAAGEKDEVERQSQQLGDFLPMTRDRGHGAWVEISRH